MTLLLFVMGLIVASIPVFLILATIEAYFAKPGNSIFAGLQKKQPTEVEHPLPIGRTEFEAWAKRVIDGAGVPGLTEDSAKFTLTSMLLHLPSTQSFKGDSFFTHALRKAAVNQTAYEIMSEIEKRLKARQAAELAKNSPTATVSALKLVPTDEKGSADKN